MSDGIRVLSRRRCLMPKCGGEIILCSDGIYRGCQHAPQKSHTEVVATSNVLASAIMERGGMVPASSRIN